MGCGTNHEDGSLNGWIHWMDGSNIGCYGDGWMSGWVDRTMVRRLDLLWMDGCVGK